jgi:hypothetical protein
MPQLKKKKKLSKSQLIRLRLMGLWQEFYADEWPEFEDFYNMKADRILDWIDKDIDQHRRRRDEDVF